MNRYIHFQKQWTMSGVYVIDDVQNYSDVTDNFRLVVLFRDRDLNGTNY